MGITQQKLFVKQKAEIGEVFTSVEGENNYIISDEKNNKLYTAIEKSNFAARNLIRGIAPFKVTLYDTKKTELYTINKQTSFIFSKYKIDTNAKDLGTIQRRFAFLKKKYTIHDDKGFIQLKCISAFFHPWTFRIFKNGQQIAVISKKWSGITKEAFTDADSFMIDYMSIKDQWLKQMILALSIAIDYDFFEKNSNNKNKNTLLNLVKKK